MQKNHTIHQMIVIYFSMFFIGAAGNLLSNTKQEKNITKAHSHKQVYFYGHRIHSTLFLLNGKESRTKRFQMVWHGNHVCKRQVSRVCNLLFPM